MPHEGLPRNLFPNDPIRSLLEEDPRLGFNTFLQQQNLGQGQQQFFRGKFQEILDQFQGALGHQIQSGEFPNLSFTQQFLPQFNLDQFRLGFSPSSRGEGIGKFNPQTQFQFGPQFR